MGKIFILLIFVSIYCQINSTVRHGCIENIFENGTMRSVPTIEPSCVLGHEISNNFESNRQKRALKVITNSINYFSIPAESPKEEVAADSYIKLQIRVCSQPGGEVLMYDSLIPNVTLNRFKNGGTAFQCNRWTMDAESAISNSAQVKVEYKLPIHDEYQSTEFSYEYLKTGIDQGHRSLAFKIGDAMIFQLDLNYTEVKFIYEEPIGILRQNIPEELIPDGFYESAPIEVAYKPNWIKTYILGKRQFCELNKCEGKNFIGISAEIMELNLDFNKGDYILIGPGAKPEFWKNSKTQLIAQRIDEDEDDPSHKFWINTDSAFIRLVTHNSLIEPELGQTALKFKWTPANTILEDEKFDEVSKLLKDSSIEMCLIGGTCQEFTDFQNRFVGEVMNIFNHYTTDNDKSVTTLISSDEVRVFDKEQVIKHHGHYSDEYCQFNLAISSPYDSEFPLVASETLNKIIFDTSNSRKMINQEKVFNNCVFQRISWSSILIPIGVIILLAIGFALLFWRMQSKMIESQNFRSRESFERIQPITKEYDDAMQY